MYLNYLNNLSKSNPDINDMEVITATDDEGNGYNKVHFSPTVGDFDGTDFTVSEEDLEENGLRKNAVCVN